ncbi:MAG: hypothetical protein AAF533_10260 [Acidobacteriota bacterium]
MSSREAQDGEVTTSLRELALRELSSPEQDARLVRIASFAAALAVLPLGLLAVTRRAATGAEVLLGTLGTTILAVLLVMLGVAFSEPKRRNID